MKVGIIGSGIVGQTLAVGFAKHGHEAEIGTREPLKLKVWSAKIPASGSSRRLTQRRLAVSSSWPWRETPRRRR